MTRAYVPVVVAFDGSEASWAAAEYGAFEAQSRGVPLRLVHVVLDRHAYAAQRRAGMCGNADLADGDAPQNLAAAAYRLTEYARVYLRGRYAIGVDVAVVARAPQPALLAESQLAELLVVGRAADGTIFGMRRDAADDMLVCAESSVAVVDPQPQQMGQPVVLGVDGGVSPAAIAYAFDAADRFGVGLRAVAVSSADDTDADLRGRLNGALSGWRAVYPRVSVSVETRPDGDAVDELVRLSTRASLIVLSAPAPVGTTLARLARCPFAFVRASRAERLIADEVSATWASTVEL